MDFVTLRIIIDRGYLRRPDIIIAYSSEDKNFENSGKLGSRFLYPVHNEVSDAGYKVQTILWDENPLSKESKIKSLVSEKNIFPFSSNYFLSYFFLKFICTPKVIVGIDMRHAVITSAKKLGIPVVESLHGFGLSDSHDKYSSTLEIKNAPNYFIAYDDLSTDTLTKNKSKDFDVFRAQHPYISNTNSTKLFFDDKKSFSSVITITLQHGYDGTFGPLNGIIDNGILHKEILKLIKKVRIL